MKSDYYTTVCWKVRWLHWKGLFKALFYIHTVYINIYIFKIRIVLDPVADDTDLLSEGDDQ